MSVQRETMSEELEEERPWEAHAWLRATCDEPQPRLHVDERLREIQTAAEHTVVAGVDAGGVVVRCRVVQRPEKDDARQRARLTERLGQHTAKLFRVARVELPIPGLDGQVGAWADLDDDVPSILELPGRGGAHAAGIGKDQPGAGIHGRCRRRQRRCGGCCRPSPRRRSR